MKWHEDFSGGKKHERFADSSLTSTTCTGKSFEGKKCSFDVSCKTTNIMRMVCMCVCGQHAALFSEVLDEFRRLTSQSLALQCNVICECESVEN